MAAEADANAATAGPGRTRSRAAVFQRLRSHAIRRMGWGVADQVVSSLTNFAVGIYVVHTLGAARFGAFSLAYVTYGFALNASRGLATGPFMVRFSGTHLPTWRRAVASCSGTAAVVGLALGALVIVVAAVLGGTAGSAFLALGLTLPGLLLQDSWRFSFFAIGRGSQAFLNDMIWAVTLLPALVILRKTGHADVFLYVLAWGVTASVGAAVGPWQARVIPNLSGAWGWLSRHRDLGPRYMAEGLASSGSTQLRTYGIGLILGLAVVGYVQASVTLMGPMTILFLGLGLVALPEAVRVLRRSPRHLPLFCVLIAVGLTAAALAWGVVLLIAVPRGLGARLLGPVWRPTYPLVLPMILFVTGQAAATGPGTGLHALGAARRSLRAMAITAVLAVVGALAGAVADGAIGTVTGMAVAAWISVPVFWWELRAAMREYGKVPRMSPAARQQQGDQGIPDPGDPALAQGAAAPQPAHRPELGTHESPRHPVAAPGPDHASMAKRAVRRPHPRQEPSALKALAGICAGGPPPQGRSLPRPYGSAGSGGEVPPGYPTSSTGRVDRDAEHPVPVRRWANDGLVPRMPLGKDRETHMRVDVVHQHDPACRHDGGCLLHLEQRVRRGVQAVVDEHLYVADLGNQPRQLLLARAFQIRPARAARIGDNYACLPVQSMIEGKRQIDAP
jgi:O-antigen/teichoic acid export membrane protein